MNGWQPILGLGSSGFAGMAGYSLVFHIDPPVDTLVAEIAERASRGRSSRHSSCSTISAESGPHSRHQGEQAELSHSSVIATGPTLFFSQQWRRRRCRH